MPPSRRSFLTLSALALGAAALPALTPRKTGLVWTAYVSPGVFIRVERPRRVTPDRMAEEFTKLETWDDKVERVWLHPETAATLPAEFGDAYDQNYQGVLLKLGIAGFLWGADVRTNEAIVKGEIELMGSKDWDGARNNLLCETACPARWPADWNHRVLEQA